MTKPNQAHAFALAACCALVPHAAAQLPDQILTNYVVEEYTTTVPNQNSGLTRDIDVTPDGSRMVFSPFLGRILDGCTSPTGASGAIYIYDYNTATGLWELNDAIKNCTRRMFGDNVSISDDGTVILVGHNAGGFQPSGQAWFYRDVGGVWAEEFAPFEAGDIFGETTDLDSSGDLAIVVAPEQLGSFFRIYRNVGGVWQVDLFVDWIPNVLNFFDGASIDGAWAAVVAGEASERHIRMYEYNGASWGFAQAIPSIPGVWGSATAPGDIEIDGETMIVGNGGVAPSSDGFVRIYELDTGTGLWTQVFEELGGANDSLGTDVDIQGDRAVATVQNLDKARHFARIGGVWQTEGDLDIPGSGVDSGSAVAVAGDRFFVGGSVTIGSDRSTIEEYAAPNVICNLTETFDSGPDFPPSLFVIERPCATQAIVGGALELSLPAGCAEGNNALLASGDLIVGDFDVSVDWDITALPTPPSGFFTVPVDLTVFGLDNQLWMRIERLRVDALLAPCEPAANYHKSWDRVSGPDPCITSLAATGSLSGSYRIIRVGSTWRTFYRNAGDTSWTPFRTAALTDEPVGFYIGQFATLSGVTTRYDNLSLSCPPECIADVTTTGAGPGDPGFGVSDGSVTTTDLNFFVNAWVALDASIADVTTTGAGPGDPGFGMPDGSVTTTDLNYYVNLFVAGCP